MKLETGYNGSFEVRHRHYCADIVSDLSILYLSDLHFTRYSGPFVSRIIAAVKELNPSIILLGGDYADSTGGLQHFTTLLRSLTDYKHVYAIAGNHDYFIGIEKVKKVVAECGIGWIEKSSERIMVNGICIQLDGNRLLQEPAGADLSVACLHQPRNIQPYKDRYNLAFAGHLHGGQCVWWQNNNALYPGRFFYKWNILEKQWDNCLFLISKGLGDTIPLRWNCKKEMIFVLIQANNNPF